MAFSVSLRLVDLILLVLHWLFQAGSNTRKLSLRSLTFIEAAKNLKSIHYAMNNFYNEPSTIKELNRMETKISKPAIKKCISATLVVLLGNAYGKSFDAIEPTEDILQKLSQSDRISIISSNVYLTMKKFFNFFRKMRVQNVGVTSSKSLILNPLNTKILKYKSLLSFQLIWIKIMTNLVLIHFMFI